MNKKLRRSRTNKVIAGVCGGVAEYFNIDPIAIRIIWVLLAFLPRVPGFLFYLLCIIIIPEDDGMIYQDDNKDSYANDANPATFISMFLVIIGGIMLAKIIWPHLAFKFMGLFRYWPILLIIAGFYILYKQKNK